MASRPVREETRSLEVPAPLTPVNAGALPSAAPLADVVQRAADLANAGEPQAAHDLVEPYVRRDGGFAPVGVRAGLLSEAARFLWMLGRYEEALARARRAAALAELAGQPRVAADSILRQGLAQHRMGAMAEARESYEEAFARFRRLGDESRAGSARNNLGLVVQATGDWDAARRHFDAAIAAARKDDLPLVLGSRLQSLGILELKQGHWRRARATLLEANSLFVAGGHEWHLAASDLALAMLARVSGQPQEAVERAARAQDRAFAAKLPREHAVALEVAGDVAFDARNWALAGRLYGEANSIAQSVAPGSDLALEILRRIARVRIAEGDTGAATPLLLRARKLAEQLGDPYELALVECVEAEREIAAGDRDEARPLLVSAIDRLGALGEIFERGRALAELARASESREDACRHGYRASACFVEAGAERELREIESWLAQHLGHAAPAHLRTSSADARDRGAGEPLIVVPPPILVGPSRAFGRVRVRVTRAARSDLPVLIHGESGVGKDRIARFIHERSGRSNEAFVVVRCRDLSRERIGAALFGDPRPGATARAAAGAFLRANRGTLYIDDVDRLPLVAQSGLMRYLTRGVVLRAGEIEPTQLDVRIIASTRVDLHDAHTELGLRRDLLSRLAPGRIDVPPLRNRREDVVPLARHFLKQLGHAKPGRMDDAAALFLIDQPWFGNVRELEECITEAVRETAGGGAIDRELLARLLDRVVRSAAASDLQSDDDFTAPRVDPGTGAESQLLRARLLELERQRILRVLSELHGNKTRAATALFISRKTLYEKMRRLGIPLTESQSGRRRVLREQAREVS